MSFTAELFASAVFLMPSPAAGTPLICIDPGHEATPDLSTEPIGPGSTIYKIKDGGGAPGEATVVLQIGLKLRSVLQARGYRVAMTRTTMDFSYGNGGNIARAKFCNRLHSALMLRLHADGSTDRSRHGVSTLYPKWHQDWTDDIFYPSRRAARLVQAAVVRSTGALDLGLVARGDLTGFNWANVPAILVEEGFMTNPTEGARLRTASYQWKVARGLANGVAAFRPLR
ncbi:MAG TPA: N-acetylmuramoyl-L-alanine amidase [Gaiellaceae bacterium]